MMDHMTEVSGLSWPRRILNTLQNDDRLLAGGAAFLGGLMTAMGRITGEVAPFGVAYAAAAPRRMTVPALLGAALGYLLMAAPPAAWQYPLAALLAVGLRQLLAVITHKARPWQNVIGVLIGLATAVILPGAYRHPLVYDVLLWMTSRVFLRGGHVRVCGKQAVRPRQSFCKGAWLCWNLTAKPRGSAPLRLHWR